MSDLRLLYDKTVITLTETNGRLSVETHEACTVYGAYTGCSDTGTARALVY